MAPSLAPSGGYAASGACYAPCVSSGSGVVPP